MTKKYNVTIEQPLVKTWTIEARDEEEAHNIAREKYNKGEFILTGDDVGTDAQVQISSEDGKLVTEWFDL